MIVSFQGVNIGLLAKQASSGRAAPPHVAGSRTDRRGDRDRPEPGRAGQDRDKKDPLEPPKDRPAPSPDPEPEPDPDPCGDCGSHAMNLVDEEPFDFG